MPRISFSQKRKHTVSVKLMGGLGNQLFQVANAISICLKENRNLYISTDWYNSQSLRTPDIRELGIQLDVLLNVESSPISLMPVSVECECSTKEVVHEKDFFFSPIKIPTNSCCELVGYWQSSLYFAEIKQEIKNLFSCRLNTSLDPLDVIVHFRIGDYLSSKSAAEIHPVQSIEYYRRALKFVDESTGEICFVSDDSDYVMNEFIPKLEIHKARDLTSGIIEDLSVLAKAKNIVIANSTFSWWGAFLGTAETVIAPKKWFTAEAQRRLNPTDLYEGEWILL